MNKQKLTLGLLAAIFLIVGSAVSETVSEDFGIFIILAGVIMLVIVIVSTPRPKK